MRLLLVNVGQPQPNPWKTMKLTGIDKRPVEGPVMVTRPRAAGMGMVGLAGDRVYDVREHGGPDRAKSGSATRSRSCAGPITTSPSPCRSGRSVDAANAVRIGVIDDHVAYAAPTSGGGFCLYFGKNPRSGPSGGTCIRRGAARDEAVFSVLPGTDGGILFGRVGTTRAQKVQVTFPRSGETVSAPTAASGFFAVKIPSRSMRSLMMVVPPDPKHPWKNVKTKDGGPVLSFQLDRVPEISVVALDGHGHIVAHGVAVAEPQPGPSSTAGPRH
jgi:hypothetical protein